MQLKIYVDVLFIINFITDYFLISITSFFIKKKVSILKTILAALIGAIYASFAFFLPAGPILLLPLSLGVSLVMLLLAFGVKRVRLFLKSIAVFYLISFVVAGAGFGLLTYFNQSFLIGGGIFYADINAYQLLAAFLICVPLVHFTIGFLKKVRIKSRFLYDITIEKDGKTVTQTALLDTGNFLKDPVSQISVLIAEWQAVAPLFSKESFADCIVSCPGEFTYIPCRTVNGVGGIFAFRPDKVSSKEISFSDPVYVGISENALDKEGAYRMILPNCVSPAQTERM